MRLMFYVDIRKGIIGDVLSTATRFVGGSGKNTMNIMMIGKKIAKSTYKTNDLFVKLLSLIKFFIAELWIKEHI